jgi:hypothetical protein
MPRGRTLELTDRPTERSPNGVVTQSREAASGLSLDAGWYHREGGSTRSLVIDQAKVSLLNEPHLSMIQLASSARKHHPRLNVRPPYSTGGRRLDRQ